MTNTLTLLLPLAFVIFTFASNSTEQSSSVSTTKNSNSNGLIPLVFHHRNASQKRQRRQYSEKAPPYEIRFLPYPAPPALRQIRGSSQDSLYGANGLESSTASSTTTSSSTTTEAPLLTYPAPTLITTHSSPSSTTEKQSYTQAYTQAYTQGYSQTQRPTQPPSGTPRDSGKGSEPSPNDSQYYYPPRMPLPLSQCFYNPTGYACCNAQLNDLMVETYSELEAKPTFHTCNINAIASMLQSKAEKRFNVTFETVAGFEDFAQKVHFNGDLICKIELGGKFMLAYGTAGKSGGNGSGSNNYNKYSGEPLKRQRRTVYGPENEVPKNDLSRSHSMWV